MRPEENGWWGVMPELLEFNPNRGLTFDPDRHLGFDPGRKVGFDPDRGLGFDSERDLGFGQRGPVFRGYVCPICNAAVTPDQPSCTECGAIFEPKAVSKLKPPAAPPVPKAPGTPMKPPAAAPPPPTRAYPPPPKRIDVNHCVYCGARVSTTDAFCWNCGNRMHAGPGR